MDRPGTTPIADLPLGGLPPSSVGDIPLSSNRIRVPGGDAGTNNSDAAAIRYNCRIDGALASGDYDAYAFDFEGGTFRARSESNLDLVADLIRASDGETLARSGTESQAFTFDGPLDAGRYILTIRVMYHAGAGPYDVVLGEPGGCVVEETATATAEPVAPTPSPTPNPTLGLQLEPATGQYANIGMRVVSVEPDGNAARAGIRPGDVILSIDQRPLRSASDAQSIVLNADRQFDVLALRDGRVWTTSIGAAAETNDPAGGGLGGLLDRLLR